MTEMFVQFDEALEQINQASEKMAFPLVKKLEKEFSQKQLPNRQAIEEYYLYLFNAKNDDEKLDDLILILQDDKTWHDFLIKQLKRSLNIFDHETKKRDEFNSELLELIVSFDPDKAANRNVCEIIENLLLAYCEHQNVKFRDKCFSLLRMVSTASSQLVLSELAILKSHLEWRIRFQAYYTENFILDRKGKYGMPLGLRLRAVFNSEYSRMLKWDPVKSQKFLADFFEARNIDIS